MAGAISLEENQGSYMNQLRPGEALFHTEGNQKPAQVKVAEPERRAVFSDEILQRAMKSRGNPVQTASRNAQSLKSSVGKKGKWWTIQLLNSILAAPNLQYTKASLERARERVDQFIQSKNISISSQVNPVRWYFAHRLTELFVRGRYALSSKARRDILCASQDTLLELLASAVGGESMQTVDNIRKAFADQDGVADSRKSAFARVSRLACEAIEKGLCSASTNPERIELVQSYFIDVDVDFATRIAVDLRHFQK
jgi:hypothetical protein